MVMKMNKIDINAWKEYRIGDIFEISRPVARSSQNYEDGETPYVASGSFNNGVQGYYTKKDEKDIDIGNCITVSPVDGYAFYQQNDFFLVSFFEILLEYLFSHRKTSKTLSLAQFLCRTKGKCFPQQKPP